MPTVGQYLRDLREQRKMSVEEVSRATRVPIASVERIETDRFDELPGEVFVRGFLKSYARAGGVPADDVLARYTASRRVAWVTPLLEACADAAPMLAMGEDEKYQAEVMRLAPAEKLDPRKLARGE